MRSVFWVVLLAICAWTSNVQGGFTAGVAAVFSPIALERHGIDQPGSAASIQQRHLPIHRVRSERQVLLHELLAPRRSKPAGTARRARQHTTRSAALAPRPAPAARTPAYRTIAPKYLPTTVDYEFDYDSEDEPGTIVIDTEEKFLYLIQKEGKARRYGIAVGREGFGWSDTVRVGRKAKWPTWTPPREMIKRQPWLAKYARGMPGGPSNPLGARALYLYDGDRDTLFRIHGSNEPWTIGQAVSSGCFRMRNEDITELFEEIPVGAKVVVLVQPSTGR